MAKLVRDRASVGSRIRQGERASGVGGVGGARNNNAAVEPLVGKRLETTHRHLIANWCAGVTHSRGWLWLLEYLRRTRIQGLRQQAINVQIAGKSGQVYFPIPNSRRHVFGKGSDRIARAQLLRIPEFVGDIF